MRAALAAQATVGEVCDTLREVWGQYQPADRF
jgi:methylmalonyl-CoA mutase N-terminal domain/subunit